MIDPENIALFDMDGTLCDYDKVLIESLEKIRSPSEQKIDSFHGKIFPKYLMERVYLISEKESFWENLPKFKLGWDVLKIARKQGFKIMILTQGPRNKPAAWSGKMKWLSKNIPDVDVTITRDKGLVYGKILVDDYPPYIERWLKNRPRGLAIMPANPGNKNFKHPNVIRYDGKNLKQVKKALIAASKRKAGEELKW